jgi:outer membrane lipoprotein-sorting protein
MSRIQGAALVLIVVLVAGCASVPKADLAGKTVNPETVQRIVRGNYEKVRSMTGSGTISVETPEMAQSGSFELFLRKPDSVLVRIEGPFGISVGSALITRDEFVFYNSLQNQVVTGPVTSANLNRILRVKLTFDELMTLFTGGRFLASDDASPETVSVEDNQYVLTYKSADGTRRYWLDPASLLITRIQHLDPGGKMYFEERYEKFRTYGDASLPRFIRVTQHATQRMIGVTFSSLAINTGGAPLVVDIPKNAERIRWQ